MQTAEYATKLVEALEHFGLAYMLVGSFASNTYGVMRSTNDTDVVVELAGTSVKEIVALMGTGFILDPQSRFESATGTQQYIISIQRSHFKLELFQLSSDLYDQVRFARRVQSYSSEMGRRIFLLTPEDVIVTKLRWSAALGRRKDVDDARDVIAVQGDALDWSYIEHWCQQHGTLRLLCDTRASIPPLP